MQPRDNRYLTESAVSEIVGALILIGMIVLVVAVIAAFLVNRPVSDQIPEVRFSVVNVSPTGQCPGNCSILLTHNGGDDLPSGEYSFFINDNSAPVTPGNIIPDPQTTSWVVGKTIVVNSSVTPEYIRVYYYNKTKVSNPALLGQRIIDTIPPTFTTVPTSSLTTNPTTSPTTVTPTTTVTTVTPTTTVTTVTPTTTVTTTIPTTTPTPCPAVTANFKANTQQFCGGPYNVQFTDLSTGSGLTYLWDFGDSTTSTSQNPSHLYTNPGVYDVTLTVRNGCGNQNTLTERDYIIAASTSYSRAVIPLLSSQNGCFAWLGYNNLNSFPVCIPINPDNKFSPGNKDLGQPTLFLPGIHQNVFSITIPGGVKWHLSPPNNDLDLFC
jgi:PKD repeat protein